MCVSLNAVEWALNIKHISSCVPQCGGLASPSIRPALEIHWAVKRVAQKAVGTTPVGRTCCRSPTPNVTHSIGQPAVTGLTPPYLGNDNNT